MTYWHTMRDDGAAVTLRRFAGHQTTTGEGHTFSGVVLDCETTGLDHRTDVVTEIALRPFTADVETGALRSVGEAYTALQDPGRPLSPEIVRLTGLTDEMLAGQAIDWEKVAAEIATADVVIAHNAAFDRGFVDQRVDYGRKIWACTKTQLDWSAYPSSRQELLCAFHGFIYDGHRALNDVDALLHLLSMGYLRPLLDAAKRPSFIVRAAGAPFSVKDALRARGYRWAAGERVWWTEVVDWKAEDEFASSLYRVPVRVQEVSPWARFAPGMVPR